MQELWLGPSHNGSYFGSREELEQAWEANRDEVMRLFANNGRRPMAWWHLGDAEALGLRWPGCSNERSYLYEHGVLDEVECAELVRFWWREFEQAQAPGFMEHDDDGRILTGARARAARFEWADIPAELIEAWQAERPRRGRKRTEPAPSDSEAPLKSEAR
jgi:hypothetical protein